MAQLVKVEPRFERFDTLKFAVFCWFGQPKQEKIQEYEGSTSV